MSSQFLSPRDLDLLIRERQGSLRAAYRPTHLRSAPLRARIGGLLIATGTAIGGDQVRRPVQSSNPARSVARASA